MNNIQDGNLRVALFPQEIVWNDKEQNLLKLQEVVSNLHPDTDLLILPETFSTGFPMCKKKEIAMLAERNTGKTIEFIKYLASKYNIAIAGSFVANTGGLFYNRAFFIEPSGEETFADKRHLFTMAGEQNSFANGHERMKVRFMGWNITMIVCYDIRFPVWCRNVDNEYDLLIAVANWPQVRVDAWNKLAIARAIENEAYVCAVDCKGTDPNGYAYDGSSAVIDFKGKDISVEGPTDGIKYGLLSKAKLNSFRTKFPAWKDADSFTLR